MYQIITKVKKKLFFVLFLKSTKSFFLELLVQTGHAQINEQKKAQINQLVIKEIEKAVSQIEFPKPPPNDIYFLPNGNNAEFLMCLGLEEVVKCVQESITNNNKDRNNILNTNNNNEVKYEYPYICSNCSTDYTPVSGNSLCEKCLITLEKKIIKAEHSARLKTAFLKAVKDKETIEQRLINETLNNTNQQQQYHSPSPMQPQQHNNINNNKQHHHHHSNSQNKVSNNNNNNNQTSHHHNHHHSSSSNQNKHQLQMQSQQQQHGHGQQQKAQQQQSSNKHHTSNSQINSNSNKNQQQQQHSIENKYLNEKPKIWSLADIATNNNNNPITTTIKPAFNNNQNEFLNKFNSLKAAQLAASSSIDSSNLYCNTQQTPPSSTSTPQNYNTQNFLTSTSPLSNDSGLLQQQQTSLKRPASSTSSTIDTNNSNISNISDENESEDETTTTDESNLKAKRFKSENNVNKTNDNNNNDNESSSSVVNKKTVKRSLNNSTSAIASSNSNSQQTTG
jgi:hypothetical protein